MIFFSHRMKIYDMFINWCEENKVAKNTQSFIAYLQINGWLNEDKIINDLKEMEK